ncbi:thyrotroph embryonic factor isoform X1 [Patella vulgata]|uniref:thyrotroph embryonic factor isoform X1 n=1 Tax=Patella vulgata TaxID=6465 RepID=UPI00217FF1AD|nr:thyrotroph embryonic factor isoform X1 [Patella vulgata]
MMNYGSSGVTLKALLEDPNLQNPPLLSSNGKDKKKGEQGAQYDFGSAFLGPNLWDKTYNDPDFNLEYMDLDEFLHENGIPLGDEELAALADSSAKMQNRSPAQMSPKQISTPPLNIQPRFSPSPIQTTQHLPQSTTSSVMGSPCHSNPPPSPPAISPACVSPPHSPVVADVPFNVSPQDLQLVTVPGQEMFDPRKRAFTEEELKPQPLIKKSKKVFVQDERKDDKYWARRNKNNTAAKRSRDARRLKENQIAMRAAFLEKENNIMKAEMEKLKKENHHLKHRLTKYETS